MDKAYACIFNSLLRLMLLFHTFETIEKYFNALQQSEITAEHSSDSIVLLALGWAVVS